MRRRALCLIALLAAVSAGRSAAQDAAFDLTNLEIPPGMFDLRDLTVMTDDAGTVTATATTVLGSAETNVLISSIKAASGKRGLILGLKPNGWSLKDIPGLSNPVLDQLTLDNVGLVITDQDVAVSSSALTPDEREFYRAIYQADDFVLTLKPGINLIATVPADKLPPDSPLITVMKALGIEQGNIFLQGTLGKSLSLLGGGGGAAAALKDVYLRAELPPMRPPGSPDWFRSGQLALEITGDPSLSLRGEMTVRIQEDELMFFLATTLARTGISLSGGLQAAEPWVGPFGIDWLTLNRVVLAIGITPIGSVQLGFAGDMVIGKKDMDVAVQITVSPAGVPTNLIVKGESDAGFGLSDLVDLQAKMVAARNAAAAATGTPTPGGAAIPLDALPDVEFRTIGLQFAPKPAPELGVERGMAIKGRLWLPTGGRGELTDFAGVDVNVGEEGIWVRGDIGALALGPLSFDDAKLDLTATRAEQKFVLKGDVLLFNNRQLVDVDVSRTALHFHTLTELYDLFHMDIQADAAFNLRNPAFRIDGVVQNDFSEVIGPIVQHGAEQFAQVGDEVLNRAGAALNGVQTALNASQATAEQLRERLERTRANAQAAVNQARATEQAAARAAAAAYAQRVAAYRQWIGTPRRQVALKAARHGAFLRAATRHGRLAARYAARRAVTDAARRVLDALPPVDRNVLLLAADQAAAALRQQLQQAQANLETIRAQYNALMEAAAQGGLPLTIERAEVHADLEAMKRGQAVQWKITGTFTGQPFALEQALDFSDVNAAAAQLLTGLIRR